MLKTENQSKYYPPPSLPGSEWQVFIIDLICGLLTAVWYTLMRAERMALRVLRAIEKLADSEAGDGRAYSPTQDVLWETEEPSYSEAYKIDLALSYECQSNAIESIRNPRGASWQK